MKAYKTLIKNALKAGYTLEITSEGEELHDGRISKYTEAIAEIESVELAEVAIIDETSRYNVRIGGVLVIPYGVDDDETIADYTDIPLIRDLLPEGY